MSKFWHGNLNIGDLVCLQCCGEVDGENWDETIDPWLGVWGIIKALHVYQFEIHIERGDLRFIGILPYEAIDKVQHKTVRDDLSDQAKRGIARKHLKEIFAEVDNQNKMSSTEGIGFCLKTNVLFTPYELESGHAVIGGGASFFNVNTEKLVAILLDKKRLTKSQIEAELGYKIEIVEEQ